MKVKHLSNILALVSTISLADNSAIVSPYDVVDFKVERNSITGLLTEDLGIIYFDNYPSVNWFGKEPIRHYATHVRFNVPVGTLEGEYEFLFILPKEVKVGEDINLSSPDNWKKIETFTVKVCDKNNPDSKICPREPR